MKIQQIIPLLFLAGICAVSAQTTNTTSHAKTMTYKLRNLQNDKATPNPTEADIKTAIAALHDDFGPVLALEANENDNTMQLIGTGTKDHFYFTGHEGTRDYSSAKDREFSAEEATKILVAYRNGDEKWKTLIALKWD